MESQESSHELFSKDSVGNYQLLFLNTTGLDVKEITKIFSKFGKVHYIKECGDKTGYRFVKYKFHDEAVKAIKGLTYNPFIKLIPPNRRYENGNTKIENNNQNNQEHNCNNSNTKNNYDNTNANQRRKDSGGNLSTTSNRNSSKSLSSDPRSLNSEEEVPDMLVPSKKGTFVNDINQKKVIVNAEEVIIGNIHVNYSAPYFLHLLDHFEPIAVSNINVIPESNIRYCHVYFKSIRYCQEVERLYDQVALSGQKLIVQRPGTLMANAVLN